MKPLIDLTGKRYGRRTVLREGERVGGRRTWVCQCDCGYVVRVEMRNLRPGQSRSCGRDECVSTHGKTNTPVYHSWQGMIQRCFNPNHIGYKHYGGRGIAVCWRWRSSFVNFLADMGEPPTTKHTIDRVNNHGHYSPDNCKWATMKEQLNNRRCNRIFTHDGVTRTVTQWAEHLGMPPGRLRTRIADGWSFHDAIANPDPHKRTRNKLGQFTWH